MKDRSNESRLDSMMTEEEDYKLKMINMSFLTIIVIGVVGNLINIVIFGKRRMKKVSTFRFLLYLSIFDLLIIMVCASEALLQFEYLVEIRRISPLLCVIHTFLTYFLIHCSNLTLMSLSIERSLVITNRHSIYNQNNKRRYMKSFEEPENEEKRTITYSSRKALTRSLVNKNPVDMTIFCIMAGVAFVNSHYLFFLKLSPEQEPTPLEFVKLLRSKSNSSMTAMLGSKMVCFPGHNQLYFTFLTDYWTWIEFSLFFVGPFIVMAVCSLIILVRIKSRNKKFFTVLLNRQYVHNRMAVARRIKRNRQMMYMLLLCSLFFLFTSLPNSIMFILYDGKEGQFMTQAVGHLFSYSNNALNFIFYGFSSEKYREEFVKSFCSKKLVKIFRRRK